MNGLILKLDTLARTGNTNDHGGITVTMGASQKLTLPPSHSAHVCNEHFSTTNYATVKIQWICRARLKPTGPVSSHWALRWGGRSHTGSVLLAATARISMGCVSVG